ncbi:MAG TPA: NAD-dependent deacylase [Bacteroidia bacterium]
MSKKQIIVFTGAGMSAESGIQTFRDSGGLWEQFKIEEVATPEAWKKDPKKVTHFYNLRRKQVMEAKPNEAHYFLADLQKKYDVQIITQNIDDLHERAGSKNVLHLHGEIMKVRSSHDETLVYDVKNWEVKIGDNCEKGSQLRPHIVWFGEMVPNMDKAARMVNSADIFITIGTSLNVYPAAGLIEVADNSIDKYLIDPGHFDLNYIANLKHIKERAVSGVKELAKYL